MQALALLCTLHADGPATLRRLHRAGCTSLQRLGAYEPDELAQILEIPPAVARRLGREAGSLAERLDLRGFGDREEAPEIAAPAGSRDAPAAAGGSPGLDRRDRVVLGRVLDRWRTGAPGVPGAGLAESEVGGVTAAEQAFLEAPSAPAAETAETAAPVAEVADVAQVAIEPVAAPRLEAFAIDGLDDALCQRLAQHDIVDLAGLVAAEPLALSRDLGLAYARVRRLQFLGARALPPQEPQEPDRPEPARTAPTPVTEVRPEVAMEVPAEVPAREVQEPSGGETPRTIVEEHVPRKFWEPRIQAREQAARPAPEPAAELPRARPRREGAALAWNFELHPPTPPVEQVAGAPAPPRSEGSRWGAGVTEGEASLARDEEGAAGPFA